MMWLAFGARLVVAAVFLMSSLTKLMSPAAFVQNVLNYRILPTAPAKALGFTLPYVELGAALLLFSGLFVRSAALVLAALLIAFMVAVAIAIKRGDHLECSCFGLLYREPIGRSTLVRDGILLGLILIVLMVDDGSLTFLALLSDISNPLSALAVVLTGVVFIASLVIALRS
jgi:uncharacterized membrane protein YphA (DoxX/SURF4 family)